MPNILFSLCFVALSVLFVIVLLFFVVAVIVFVEQKLARRGHTTPCSGLKATTVMSHSLLSTTPYQETRAPPRASTTSIRPPFAGHGGQLVVGSNHKKCFLQRNQYIFVPLPCYSWLYIFSIL